MGGSQELVQGLGVILKDFNQINFLLIITILIIAWLLVIAIRNFLPWLSKRLPVRFQHFLLSFIPVLKLLVYALTIVIVLPQIIKPTPENMIAVLVTAGVAIGFAFKDYISSLIAGVVAIYERTYRPGDRVKINGAYGEIKSLGLRALKMVTPDDTTVIIPHNKIWNAEVFNANDGQRELLCVADFYLHPEHDAVAVRKKLIDTALTSPYLKIDKPVNVIVKEKPWATHYKLKAYAMDGRDEFNFISDLTVRGKAALLRIKVKPASVLAVAEGKL